MATPSKTPEELKKLADRDEKIRTGVQDLDWVGYCEIHHGNTRLVTVEVFPIESNYVTDSLDLFLMEMQVEFKAIINYRVYLPYDLISKNG